MTHPWELTEENIRRLTHDGPTDWDMAVAREAQRTLWRWQRALCQDHDMGPSLSGHPYHLPHGECPICCAALNEAMK